jgi:hypothetical protein
MGLLTDQNQHFNAKVSPRLFQAAAKRIGTTSPGAVINAASHRSLPRTSWVPGLPEIGVCWRCARELLDQIDSEPMGCVVQRNVTRREGAALPKLDRWGPVLLGHQCVHQRFGWSRPRRRPGYWKPRAFARRSARNSRGCAGG